jgi:hypothetical protein
MMSQDETRSSHLKGEAHTMKKLMTLMIGMSLMFGTVAVVFGQDAPKKEDTKKSGKKKGGKKKSGDDTKKDAGK